MSDAPRIDPGTEVGPVRLRVRDLDSLAAFYERVLGLSPIGRGERTAELGPEGGEPLVELQHDPGAPARPASSPGLFHLAVLVPDRAWLARALARLAGAGWRLTGASDHLVSEALYLRDPEDNGIEIYRDRPREEWPHKDGAVEMATLPLDLEGVISELGQGEPAPDGMPPGTTIGHVHLQVSDIHASGAFYEGALGFDMTARSYPGALFLSAGGYHHHVGLNVWNSGGSPPAPEGALGLDRFEVRLPGTASLAATVARLEAAGAEPVETAGGAMVTDPSGNRILLTNAA